MKAFYTEWPVSVTTVIDTDEFWLNWIEEGYQKANKYWLDCQETEEWYCYGRNDPNVNLQYAENGWFKMQNTYIPTEIWDVPNNIFLTLIKKV